jgi:L-ascorbate metabolism protein UlaG (beta-lactamase superfamily)
MKRRFVALAGLALAVFGVVASCSLYQPLKDRELYRGAMKAPEGEGVTVTYFGNSTILISDGHTRLLVDGFFSRPGFLRTALGKVESNEAIVRKQLNIVQKQLALDRLPPIDALLLGHTHFDHALDAPLVACLTGAKVIASSSYKYLPVAKPCLEAPPHQVEVPSDGLKNEKVGEFLISFLPSQHIPPHLLGQGKAQGDILTPIKPRARAVDYKHGDVFAIHISHPQGNIAITTTAGAKAGQFCDRRADVLLLAVGLLEKESEASQERYWLETVEMLDPGTVIPIHWDNFTQELDTNMPLQKNLRATSIRFVQDTKPAMDFVKAHSGKRDLWVMGLRDSFLLKEHHVERQPEWKH